MQLCTKGIGGKYKTIRDVRMEVQNNATVFWVCESYVRLEDPTACSQLQPFQFVQSQDRKLDRQFHQVDISRSSDAAASVVLSRVRHTELHAILSNSLPVLEQLILRTMHAPCNSMNQEGSSILC